MVANSNSSKCVFILQTRNHVNQQPEQRVWCTPRFNSHRGGTHMLHSII